MWYNPYVGLFWFIESLSDRSASEPKGLPIGGRHAYQDHSWPGAASSKLQAAEEGG